MIASNKNGKDVDMKKRIGISIAVAGVLLMGGISALNAENAMKDSVAKKEAEVVANPSALKSEAAAKAKVEEANAKEKFEAKMKAGNFEADAKAARAARLQRVFASEASAHKGIQKAPKEIMEAIDMTIKAAQAIKAGKVDDAAKNLEIASKDFEKALKADPSLDLVPLAMQINIKTFAGDSKIIEEAIERAGKLLKEKRTQDARDIVLPLQDEMDFITQYIPMKIYPVATKKAQEALKAGKKDEALAILAQGFGTFITVKEVIPIPLMLAADMVNEASKIDKNKKDDALKLLEMAKEQLKRAELLGYTGKHSQAYASLKKQIDAIEDEIKGKNMVEKLYEKLKGSFESLFKDVREDRVQQKN
jgi:tetratricopeptide (TPR) repeat protein